MGDDPLRNLNIGLNITEVLWELCQDLVWLEQRSWTYKLLLDGPLTIRVTELVPQHRMCQFAHVDGRVIKRCRA